MTFKNLISLPLLVFALLSFVWAPVAAQSPNTATMIVVVVDQSGAVVKDAKVSVLNTATGDLREAVSGSDGNATFPALSLTGTYKVTVSREGFGNEERKDLTLRSGETATLKVTLLAGSQTALHTAKPHGVSLEYAAGVCVAGGRQSCLHRPLPPVPVRRKSGSQADAEPEPDVSDECRSLLR